MEPTRSSSRIKRLKALKEEKISDLHDDILQLILPFIDTRTLVQSSVLGKRWRYLWTCVPSLFFTNPSVPNQKRKLRSKSFVDFVNKVLTLRDKSSIQSIHINSDYDCTSSNVNAWIHYAVTHNVEELRLCVYVSDGFVQLPECSCESIKVLQLISRDKINFMYGDNFRLCQLQVLHLEGVSNTIRGLIKDIIDNCPRLETLVIKSCVVRVSKCVCISSVHLKKLVLDRIVKYKHGDKMEIKICAPNLTSLRLGANRSELSDYSLENLTALVTADIDLDINAMSVMQILNGLCSIKDLTLRLQRGLLEVICTQTLFFNLRRLELLNVRFDRPCIRATTHLLKTSSHVETLIVEEAEGIETIMEEACLELEFQLEGALDYLKTVVIRNFRATNGELAFLKTLLKYGLVLEKITLMVSKVDGVIKKTGMRKVEKFQRASPCILVSFCRPKTSVEFARFYLFNK